MRNLTSITSFFIILFISKIGIAQTENKDVTITASGSGFTMEAAKQSALRSATEQAFGAFISSKTEMFNDQIVADQMASVSSGNIKSYEVLNESELPNGKWAVTLKAIVSVDKLTSFVEAKGVATEIKGGLFALNVKQQLLNEQAEIQAVAEMVGLLHEPMQMAFDYAVKSGEPKSIDAESKNWKIPLSVTATCNKNIDFCANYCIKTLAALSLSPEEVVSYKSLNKQTYKITIIYKSISKTFFLRKQRSVEVLITLMSNWEFYTRLFTVQSGLSEANGSGHGEIHQFGLIEWSGGTLIFNPNEIDSRTKKSVVVRKDWQLFDEKKQEKDRKSHEYNMWRSIEDAQDEQVQIEINVLINFPSSTEKVATFEWEDKLTLQEIEQITGYSAKPRGVISQFKHGGFIVKEENGHGLVAAIVDIEKTNSMFEDVVKGCEELILNGYNDWYLPSREECEVLEIYLIESGIGNIRMDLSLGMYTGRYYHRPVRTF